MGTIFGLAAIFSLVAFVVGMFSPQTVKCKSRGIVALIFVPLFFIFINIESSLSEKENYSTTQSEKIVDSNVDNSTNNSPKQEKSNSEIESSIGKPIQIGYFVYTIKNVSFRKTVGNEFTEETADGIYMIVNLSIKNISSETRTLDGSLFAVTDKDGIKYEYSINASTTLELSGYKTLFLKECQPNITTNGILIFEVPEEGDYYLHLLGSFWGTKSVRVLLK